MAPKGLVIMAIGLLFVLDAVPGDHKVYRQRMRLNFGMKGWMIMDDLISRKALIDDLCQDREEGTFDFTEKQAEAADKIIMYINSRIEAQSPVPAVPLDKLCEWLERYATMYCDGCREAFGSCEDEENQEVSECNSRERWKTMLTKWMEEQNADAAD